MSIALACRPMEAKHAQEWRGHCLVNLERMKDLRNESEREGEEGGGGGRETMLAAWGALSSQLGLLHLGLL